jgi:DNA-binding HxlR family transcriptional regulator
MENNGEIPAADPGLVGCPLDPVLKLLALKWLVHIVWYLGRSKSMRFAELQRQLPGMVSAKVLSARLRELDALGVVQREDKGVSPPHVEYRLTEYGHVINDFLAMVELESRRVLLADPSRIALVLPPKA